MATETVVHDQARWAVAAMERRLGVAKAQLLQKQQKNEKDKKGTSDVAVSSKEPHQADSLPTPSKTSIKKDPKEDDYVAYTKLSQPVDENLLATNVKFSSAKGTIVDKVLHNLLRSGDSAQKYLQGIKSVKLDNYIHLDNFVQSRSSASGSKKASEKNSKRSKSRMSMKGLKKSGALHMPKDLQQFDLFKPMHGMWESYMMQLIKVTGKIQLATTLLTADLHGAFMFVAECKIASFTRVQGVMVRETLETFGIITRDNKFRVVPKKLSVFIIQLDCWKITLHGDNTTRKQGHFRPEYWSEISRKSTIPSNFRQCRISRKTLVAKENSSKLGRKFPSKKDSLNFVGKSRRKLVGNCFIILLLFRRKLVVSSEICWNLVGMLSIILLIFCQKLVGGFHYFPTDFRPT